MKSEIHPNLESDILGERWLEQRVSGFDPANQSEVVLTARPACLDTCGADRCACI